MVLLTVLPSAPKTSIGSIIWSAVVRADPMEITAAARTAGTRRDGDNCLGLNFCSSRQSRTATSLEVFFRSQIVSMKNLLAAGDYQSLEELRDAAALSGGRLQEKGRAASAPRQMDVGY